MLAGWFAQTFLYFVQFLTMIFQFIAITLPTAIVQFFIALGYITGFLGMLWTTITTNLGPVAGLVSQLMPIVPTLIYIVVILWIGNTIVLLGGLLNIQHPDRRGYGIVRAQLMFLYKIIMAVGKLLWTIAEFSIREIVHIAQAIIDIL